MVHSRATQKVLVRLLMGSAVILALGNSSFSQTSTGWPNQAGSQVFASPAVVDIDGDEKAEIIIASVSKGVYVWHHDATLASGWPKATTHEVRASVAVGNLDQDEELELVVCTSDDTDVGSATENYVYVFNHDGTLLGGFPKAISNTRILSAPTIGNIAGSTAPEILVYAGDTYLYAWDSSGSTISGYPKNLGGLDVYYGNMAIMSSPALADTDTDAPLEVFVGSTGALFYYFSSSSVSDATSTSNWVLSSPSVADIDDDGNYEAVVGSGDGKVYVWEIGTTALSGESGWPQATRGLVYSSPALADIDGNDNGKLEIVCGAYDNKVYVWNHDGTLLDGWPQETRGYVLGSPAVADLDGDNMAEIVVGSAGRKVYVWNHDGTLLAGWPKTLTTDIYSSPAIADLDGDGKQSIVIADFNGIVYEWELSYDTGSSTFGDGWPMFGRDPSRGSWAE